MRVFGKASDFYRLRVLKVNEDSEPDLDWQSDILWKRPEASEPKTEIWYLLQAVSIDNENAFPLKRFSDGEMAMRYRDKVEELLRNLTKQEFERKFSAVDFNTPRSTA
jgi:hypothetical protein